MKKVLFGLMCMCVAVVMTSYADVTVYENNYNGETLGAGFPAWNWGTDICVHTAVFADWGSADGGLVVEHTGAINGGTAGGNARFGSMWDIAMSGNTSSNAADYTISFDVWNAYGNWDPIELQLFVVPGNVGNGIGGISLSQADGWVHVEYNLADLNIGWWNGTAWDLTSATWSLELGGPGWPGTAVGAGEAWDQIWLMDNLKITVPEPASLVLLGLGSLAMLRKRK